MRSLVAVMVVGRTRPMRDDGTTAGETDVVRVTLARDAAQSRGGVAVNLTHGSTVGGPQSN